MDVGVTWPFLLNLYADYEAGALTVEGFSKILKHVEQNAPLRRNVTLDDVGNAAAFLLSDLASGITGEITYVDAGYSTVMVGAL